MALTMMITIAHAGEGEISLPQQDSDPVKLHFVQGGANLQKEEAADMLQIYVGSSEQCCETRTPVAGRYIVDNDILTFTPAFGFNAGQDYVVRVQTPEIAEKLVPFIIHSGAASVDAAVTEIYPSGDIIPENVLRFYLHFSTPMSPHVAFDHIKLRDASGNVDEAAFMRFKQELWNEDRTRLTVLIDPGRIKREVATNRELGPALLAGQQYTLSVDGGWPSADGTSILPEFSKTFTVSNAVRERPDVKFWQATSPCIGTREPLNVTFDRPFDRHLLSTDIRVIAEDRHVIDGMIRVGDDERSWSFNPSEPWAHEDLQIVASTELEDVAGNNFRDLLDHVKSDDASDISSSVLTINLTKSSQ